MMQENQNASWMNADQSYFESIFLNTGIGILRATPEGRFLECNPKFCETVGYTQAELKQLSFFDITHPEDLKQSQAWTSRLNSNQNIFGVKRYIHKQGHVIWARLSSTSVLDPSGKVQYFVSAVEDISEQKASEELLRHQSEVLELMAKNLPLNDTLARIVRLIEEQAPGALSTIYLIEEGRLKLGAAPSFPEEFLKAVNGAPIGPFAGSCGAAAYHAKPIISTHIESDPWWGEYREWIMSYGLKAAWSTPVISKDGKVIGTVSMCWKEPKEPTPRHFELASVATKLMGIAIERDQTERFLRENQMKMVTSSKLAALGEMASGLAHEINNPLAIISNGADLLISALEKAKADPPLIEATAKSILNTVERISKIIKGLRAFARDGEHDPIQETPVEPILMETLAICRERFRSNNIELRVRIAPEAKLHCQPIQISQVLLNLLNNSFDAVEFKKEKWVEVSVEDHEDNLLISVTDSGDGIPESVRSKITQPFFTTKPVNKGTGLGLSISSSIISSHGGTLQLDTNSKNTRFNIHLPKKHRPARDIHPDI